MSNWPLPNFVFQLHIDNEHTSFQEVSGMEMEQSQEITPGGENRFKQQPTNLTLKRGLISLNSPIYAWLNDSIRGDLSNLITTKKVQIVLVDAEQNQLMSWTFHHVYPIKWTLEYTDKQKNTVAVQEVELAYSSFETHNSTK